MKRRIEEMCKAVADANRAEVIMDFIGSFPATDNDEFVVDKLIKSACKVLAHEDIVELEKPAMGNDDMACFLEKVPGANFSWAQNTRNMAMNPRTTIPGLISMKLFPGRGHLFLPGRLLILEIISGYNENYNESTSVTCKSKRYC